jgi:predicted nucleic acid-binding protein
MHGYLLDTSVIIDWLRGYSPTVSWLRSRIEAGARLVLSPVTVAETMAGTGPADRGLRRRQVTAFEFAPLDFEAAAIAGERLFDLRSAGRRAPLPDLLPGAQAQTLGLVLATSNPLPLPLPQS